MPKRGAGGRLWDLPGVDHPGARLLRAEGPAPAPPTPAEAKEVEIAEEFGSRSVPEVAPRPAGENPNNDNSHAMQAITELGTPSVRLPALAQPARRDTIAANEIGPRPVRAAGRALRRGPLHAGELAEVVGGDAATVSGMLDTSAPRSWSSAAARSPIAALSPSSDPAGSARSKRRKALWRRRWEEALGLDEEELRWPAASSTDRDIFTERPRTEAYPRRRAVPG